MSSKNVGSVMIATILATTKRTGNAREGVSIETLAASAEVSLKDAYSRLFWLEKREGKLVSTGKGAEKVYRLAAKTFKALTEV
jgi:hypothetical protein